MGIWLLQILFFMKKVNIQIMLLLLNMFHMLEIVRAMDEYTSEIFMHGRNTISMHNTCEDSLLAAPIILDLLILSELISRITYKTGDMEEYERFHPILSVLSYLLKAPLVPSGAPVVNALKTTC